MWLSSLEGSSILYGCRFPRLVYSFSWFEILKIQELLQLGFCPPGDVDEMLQVYSVRF